VPRGGIVRIASRSVGWIRKVYRRARRCRRTLIE
jgi:hypothetical protein